MSLHTPSSRPRVGMRAKHKIKFYPYLWASKNLDTANPTLHAVVETVADVVDPDGGYCWLAYASIADRSQHISSSAVEKAIPTLVKHKVLRKVTGQERLDVLDRAGAHYNPKQPPTVLELLIPASAYGAEDLERVNAMRAELGRPAITAETRPDIIGLIGEAKKPRADKGKSSPNRRPKDVREAKAEFAEQKPSLYETQDLEGPPEDPFGDTPPSHRGGYLPLTEGGTHLSQRYNPYELDPRDADPASSPSVDSHPQGPEPAGQGTDGAENGEVARQEQNQHVPEGGGDAPRSPRPRVSEEGQGESESMPPTMAEKVVDRLLAETARVGARPLENPEDRAHLVGLAARAIEGGMPPGTLWSIASVGLHNVKRQWALTARLADPKGFSKIKQADFGGTTLGGPQAPMCGFHPQAALDGNGRCAECAEADYQAALARGELRECTLSADGIWRDHQGTPLDSLWDFEGMTQDEIGQALEERERVRASLTGDAHKGATDAREALRKSRSSAALRALTAPESDEESQSGVPGAAGGS